MWLTNLRLVMMCSFYPTPLPPPTPCLPPTTLRFKGTFKKLLKATRKEKTGRYKFGKKIATSRRQGDVLVYWTIFAPEILGFSSLFRAFFLGTLQNSPSAYSLHDRGAHCLPSLLSYLKRPGIWKISISLLGFRQLTAQTTYASKIALDIRMRSCRLAK